VRFQCTSDAVVGWAAPPSAGGTLVAASTVLQSDVDKMKHPMSVYS
jgi:hypothetical protein